MPMDGISCLCRPGAPPAVQAGERSRRIPPWCAAICRPWASMERAVPCRTGQNRSIKRHRSASSDRAPSAASTATMGADRADPERHAPRRTSDGRPDPSIALAHWRAVREDRPRHRSRRPTAPCQRAHVTPAAPLRGRRRARSATGARRLRPRAPQQRRRHAGLQRVGRITTPCSPPAAARCRSSGWPATRAACSSRSATRRTAETYGAGRYLVDAAEPRGRPGDRHAHPRLQLRVPAVVRLRSALGVPAGAAGEPPRHPDPRRRASEHLTAEHRTD